MTFRHKLPMLALVRRLLPLAAIPLLLSACAPISPDFTESGTVPAMEEEAQTGTLPVLSIDIGAEGISVSEGVVAGPNAVMLTNSLGTTDEEGSLILPEVGRIVAPLDDEAITGLIAMAEENPVPALEAFSLYGYADGGENLVWDLLPGDYFTFVLGEDTFERFTVAEGEGATAPVADVIVELLDFSFTMPESIDSGMQTWEIVNNGEQWHEIAFMQLAEGMGVDDVMAFFESEEAEGPPPFNEFKHVAPFSEGNRQWVDLDFAPGNWLVICFLPDITSDFSPHFVHGMVRNLTVN